MNLSEYLIRKIEQLGIEFSFGLIEKETSFLINAIECNSNIKYIQCTSDINSAYAADGYAKYYGCGVIITNYGASELNILSLIEANYKDNMPIIVLVETPEIKDLKLQSNWDLYFEIYKKILDTAVFLNRDNAKIEIDKVFKAFSQHKKSIYIAIPKDIATLEIQNKNTDFENYNFELKNNKISISESKSLIKSETKDKTQNNITENKINLENVLYSLETVLYKDDALVINTKWNKFIENYFTTKECMQLHSSNLNGWGIPATLGICSKKLNGKIMLLVDEISYEHSAFEIKNFLKNGYKPTIIILNSNNENDSFIDYIRFSRIFNGEIWSTKVNNNKDLEKALRVVQIINKICFIEIFIDLDNKQGLKIDKKNDIEKGIEENNVDLNEKDINNTEYCLNKKTSYTTYVHTSLKELE